MNGRERELVAAFLLAVQMLRARALRTGLMILQFTAGFSALLVLAILVASSRAKINTLETTFGRHEVVGLYPAVIDSAGLAWSTGRPLSVSDVPALERLPGVARASAIWQTMAHVPGQGMIRVYAVNEAFEKLVRLRVSRQPQGAPSRVPGSGREWVFVTEAAQGLVPIAGRREPATLQVTLGRQVFTVRVAGVVTPPAGWPPPIAATLESFAVGVPALVIDLAAVEEIAWLGNAVWLVLDDGANVAAVREAVGSWFTASHPGETLRAISVSEEIEKARASQSPATWVAGVLAALLLVLGGLGLIGHSLLATELRRSEWALRGTLGARRRQLMGQVAAELGLVVCGGALLSIVLVGAFTPVIVGSGRGRWLASFLPAAALVFVVALALRSGRYPAPQASLTG